MIATLLALAYILFLLLTGFLALRIVRWDSKETVCAEWWLPLSFALGIGAQAFATLAALAVAARATLLPNAVAFLLLLIANVALHRRLATLDTFGNFTLLHAPKNPAHARLYWGGWALVAIFFATMFANAQSYPMASYDGRAIWGYKAKILHEEQTTRGEIFHDPARVHYHPDYPLAVPAMAKGLHDFIGRVDEDRLRFLYSAMMVFFGLYLFQAIAATSGNAVALFFTLVYAGGPFREFWVVNDAGGINSGEADFPLSMFAAMAAAAWCAFWRDGFARTQWVLAGLLTGTALCIKKEGIVVFAVLAAANGAMWLFFNDWRKHAPDGIAHPSRAQALRALLAAAGLSLLVALPWLAIARTLPNHYDEKFSTMFRWDIIVRTPERLPLIWYMILGDAGEISKWNWTWYAWAVVLLSLAWRRAAIAPVRFFILVVLLWLAAITVTYMLSPLSLVFHLNTSLRRLLAQMYPIVLMTVGLSVSALRGAMPSQLFQSESLAAAHRSSAETNAG